jgi:hypothetical protein
MAVVGRLPWHFGHNLLTIGFQTFIFSRLAGGPIRKLTQFSVIRLQAKGRPKRCLTVNRERAMTTDLIARKPVSQKQRRSLSDLGAVYLFSALGLLLSIGAIVIIGFDKLTPILAAMSG